MNQKIGTEEFSRRALLTGVSATCLVALATPAFAALKDTFRWAQSTSAPVDHSAWNSLLGTYVKADGSGYNRVDYRAFKSAGHAALKDYVKTLSAASPTKMSRADAFAFWANTYNAVTIDVVLDHYPVSSIKKIKLGGGGLFGSGPWSKKLITIEGTALSLDDIEHKILRAGFGDKRVHYALNCASLTCPNLPQQAFTGSNLESLLQQGERDYINHPRALAVKNGRITASKIYSWYADEFGGKRNLKAYWAKHAAPEKAKAISEASLGKFTYDWSLNDVR